MGLITSLAEAMAFVRVIMRFNQNAVFLQRLDHVAGLLRHHHGIQFTLEENHRNTDVACVQQRRSCGVTFGVRDRITDQPIQVVTFELVGRVAERDRIADAVQAGTGAEDLVEGQCAKGGVAARAATANKRLVTVDQPALGEPGDYRASIFDIDIAPAQMQRLAISPTVAAAAAVIEVGHGEAALCPVLDTRVEHRVAGRGRAAVDEHHEGGFASPLIAG